MTTRREFVSQASRGAAGFMLTRGAGSGRIRQWLPLSTLRAGVSATPFLADVPLDLEGLTTGALDAAKKAGASFADMRLAEWYELTINWDGSQASVALESNFNYGLRVIVNGGSACAHGCLPDSGSLANAAAEAVDAAKGYAVLVKRPVALAPVPAVQGQWTTPIHIDPFTVPLQDQIDLVGSLGATSARVLGLARTVVQCRWSKEVRVFGSTDGTLVRQTLYRSRPELPMIEASRTFLAGNAQQLARLGFPASGGYETMLAREWPDQLKLAVERADELSRMPQRRFGDVGRYPVVLDGAALGKVFSETIGLGLEADRALGYMANTGSYLAPPAEVLGKTMINPLLNVTATRAMPHFSAVQWDDEGVVPQDYPVLKEGVVVNYHTSRQSALALGAPRSNGCAVAFRPYEPVMVRMPHLDVAPATSRTSVEDLCREARRGLLIMRTPFVAVDHQLSSGGLYPTPEVFEIQAGKIVGRVRTARGNEDVGVDFVTRKFWQALTALGGAETVEEAQPFGFKGYPSRLMPLTVTAPAGLFTDLNVVIR